MLLKWPNDGSSHTFRFFVGKGFGRKRKSRRAEAAGRRNSPEAVPKKMKFRKGRLTRITQSREGEWADVSCEAEQMQTQAAAADFLIFTVKTLSVFLSKQQACSLPGLADASLTCSRTSAAWATLTVFFERSSSTCKRRRYSYIHPLFPMPSSAQR